jgi:hypothetical protein
MGADRPQVVPLATKPLPDGRVAVTVRQVVRSLAGEVLNDVAHVYELHDG